MRPGEKCLSCGRCQSEKSLTYRLQSRRYHGHGRYWQVYKDSAISIGGNAAIVLDALADKLCLIPAKIIRAMSPMSERFEDVYQ